MCFSSSIVCRTSINSIQRNYIFFPLFNCECEICLSFRCESTSAYNNNDKLCVRAHRSEFRTMRRNGSEKKNVPRITCCHALATQSSTQLYYAVYSRYSSFFPAAMAHNKFAFIFTIQYSAVNEDPQFWQITHNIRTNGIFHHIFNCRPRMRKKKYE